MSGGVLGRGIRFLEGFDMDSGAVALINNSTSFWLLSEVLHTSRPGLRVFFVEKFFKRRRHGSASG